MDINKKLPRDVVYKLKAAHYFLTTLRHLHKDFSENSIQYQSFYFEAALFELTSSKDAFLIHLNSISSSPLSISDVKESNLINHFSEIGETRLLKIVQKIDRIKRKKGTWLNLLMRYRNTATHKRFIPPAKNISAEITPIGPDEFDDEDKPAFRFKIKNRVIVSPGDIFTVNHHAASDRTNKLFVSVNPENYEMDCYPDELILADKLLEYLFVKLQGFLEEAEESLS